MKILSIETSCDDTAISVMEVHPPKAGKKGGITSPRPNAAGGQASFKVLANNTNSQINIHIPYGGVFPALAKREHLRNLPILLEKTLKEANLTPYPSPGKRGGIDLITVTYGPGLEPSLWTGVVFAKELAEKWKVPLMPVNHVEGHILSVFENKTKIKTPTISLLVSGGHTELVFSKKWMQYEIIGETVDDAVGEAFDKVARMLGLPYPGGPQISLLAEKARKDKLRITNYEFEIKLPRPMLHSKDFNFSFSGLKTAVLYMIRDLGGLEKISEETKMQIALEFENAAIECLVHKTQKALEKYKIKTLIVAGGVSANQHLQNEMKKAISHTKGRASKKIKVFFPKKELTGDNSIMIGIAGYLNYLKNKKKVPKLDSIKATGNLRLG
jgi:N6-L-threonylcarbamoyladenine synthase